MYSDAYRGRLGVGSASLGQQMYRGNASFGQAQRQARQQQEAQGGAQGLQRQQNAYSLYTQAGQLATNAYQNQLANTGAFRNFALGALTGLMR